MERYVDGDIDAFNALHQAILPPISGSLRKWLRAQDCVDDAVQMTLLRLHSSRSRYKRGAPVLPWALTIARHVAIDQIRARERRKESTLDEGASAAPEPELDWSKTDETEIIEAVRLAIEALPSSSRDVIRLHKLEERPMEEVATILGIKAGAARVRAHRGYRALERLLVVVRSRRG